MHASKSNLSATYRLVTLVLLAAIFVVFGPRILFVLGVLS